MQKAVEQKETIIQIVWISEAVRDFDNQELLELLTQSRANNSRKDVTGLLLYHERSFLQIMEGERETVEDIFENRICESRKHREVTLLLKREIEERSFENWTMGFMSNKDGSLDKIPGFIEFSRAHSSFLGLKGDRDMVRKFVEGFHDGRWHLGQPVAQPNPV